MEVSENLEDSYCLVCGGKIWKKANKNKYRCTNCGEVYELEEFDTFEIELSMFDKLLLHSLKKKRTPQQRRIKQMNIYLWFKFPLSCVRDILSLMDRIIN